MDRGKRMIGGAIAVAVLAGIGSVWATSASAQPLVERGQYLVNGILGCGNCHTPRIKGGAFDTARELSGGPQIWDTPAFRVRGSNITPDPETGIGKWSAAEIRKSLVDGERPDGTPIAPIMPYAFYRIMMPSDLDAVVAYLQSVPAVRNAVETPIYRAAAHGEGPPGTGKPMRQADMKDPVKRGFYLVTIGHCMECHTPMVKGRHDFAQLGKGGREFKGPWGVSVSSNITSHKTAGLGAWTDDEIKAAITKGHGKDGKLLRPPMAYELYASISAQDLAAVVAYLRTVPARE